MKHSVPSHGLCRFTANILCIPFSYVFIYLPFQQFVFPPWIQAFLRFMRGRCPQTILTDLDPGLRDAIRSELPGTKHVTSFWNILCKLPSWFSLPLGSRYAEFKSEFDALYRVDNVEEFELRWNQMVPMFGLGSDKHIALLFSLRASWALSYMRGYFLAQMASQAYSKSVDAFLKGVFSAQTCLRSFFEQVGCLKVFDLFSLL